MGVFKDLIGLAGRKIIKAPIKTGIAVGTGAMAITLGMSSHAIPVKPATGPLAKLEAENNPFIYQTLQYPNEGLGDQYPHYITFYMNVRENTKYKEHYKYSTTNKESEIQNSNFQPTGLASYKIPVVGKYLNFDRQTVRTSQSIRLYMPDTMHWTFNNQWRDNVHLADAIPLAKATELGTSVVDAVKALSGGESLSTVAKRLGTEATALGLETLGPKFNVERDVALRSFGYAINPNIDVIYSAPELRQFQFDFMFAPRNTAEANQVLAIIRSFKFHASPESSPDSASGRYWIPPTEFDIEFSLRTMGKISRCVLKSIDVDYSPNGFNVYREDSSEYDMPTNIGLRLQFSEIEFMTKEKILQGY